MLPKLNPLLSISWTQFRHLIFWLHKFCLFCVIFAVDIEAFCIFITRGLFISKTLQTWWIYERLKPNFAVFSFNFRLYPSTTISHRSFVILLFIILLFSFCIFCYQPSRDLLICIFCRKMNIIFGYIWWCLSLVVYLVSCNRWVAPKYHWQHYVRNLCIFSFLLFKLISKNMNILWL